MEKKTNASVQADAGDHDEAASRRATQDEKIIAALASGLNYTLAGVAANVSDRTVARRMSEPGFARRVAARRDEVVVSAVGQLTSLVDEAVDGIRSGLVDESARTRMAAGKLILELVLRFRQTFDLELQVAEIRAHLGMED